MLEGNDSQLENNSFTFYSPIGLVLHDDEIMFEENSTIKILLTIYLGVAMVLGLLGNICTCAVIVRNRSMRTPTNCYLFNLAVTDILTACFVPIEIYIIWIPEFYPLGEVGCRIHFMLWDFIINCNILIITAFTVERYLVVSRPFLRQKMSLNSRVYKIVVFIWLISLLFSVPDFYFLDLLERKKYVFCYFTVSYTISIIITTEIFVFYVVPMTVITVLYILIIIDLKSARKKLRRSPVSVQQNKDKAVKMLERLHVEVRGVTPDFNANARMKPVQRSDDDDDDDDDEVRASVAATFFFFWSPYCILRVAMVLPRYTNADYYSSWKILNYLCYNSYLSTVANPILYSLMSQKFRQAFKDLLKGTNEGSRNRIDAKSFSLSITRVGGEGYNQNFTKNKLFHT